eukprot:m.110781 g.110781  ORF g.110781 m.110781 type:complete len:355 (+) comp9070_c1_seq4:2970-4034(+)
MEYDYSESEGGGQDSDSPWRMFSNGVSLSSSMRTSFVKDESLRSAGGSVCGPGVPSGDGGAGDDGPGDARTAGERGAGEARDGWESRLVADRLCNDCRLAADVLCRSLTIGDGRPPGAGVRVGVAMLAAVARRGPCGSFEYDKLPRRSDSARGGWPCSRARTLSTFSCWMCVESTSPRPTWVTCVKPCGPEMTRFCFVDLLSGRIARQDSVTQSTPPCTTSRVPRTHPCLRRSSEPTAMRMPLPAVMSEPSVMDARRTMRDLTASAHTASMLQGFSTSSPSSGTASISAPVSTSTASINVAEYEYTRPRFSENAVAGALQCSSRSRVRSPALLTKTPSTLKHSRNSPMLLSADP